jgi:hypothetical protein
LSTCADIGEAFFGDFFLGRPRLAGALGVFLISSQSFIKGGSALSDVSITSLVPERRCRNIHESLLKERKVSLIFSKVGNFFH